MIRNGIVTVTGVPLPRCDWARPAGIPDGGTDQTDLGEGGVGMAIEIVEVSRTDAELPPLPAVPQ